MQTDANFLFSPTKIAIVAGMKALLLTFHDTELLSDIQQYILNEVDWDCFTGDFESMTSMVDELDAFLSNHSLESTTLKKYETWVKENERYEDY